MKTRSARITGKYLVKPNRHVVCTRFADWSFVVLSGEDFNKSLPGLYSMPLSVFYTKEAAQEYLACKIKQKAMFSATIQKQIGGEARAAQGNN